LEEYKNGTKKRNRKENYWRNEQSNLLEKWKIMKKGQKAWENLKHPSLKFGIRESFSKDTGEKTATTNEYHPRNNKVMKWHIFQLRKKRLL
jgi:hypothetical protein